MRRQLTILLALAAVAVAAYEIALEVREQQRTARYQIAFGGRSAMRRSLVAFEQMLRNENPAGARAFFDFYGDVPYVEGAALLDARGDVVFGLGVREGARLEPAAFGLPDSLAAAPAPGAIRLHWDRAGRVLHVDGALAHGPAGGPGRLLVRYDIAPALASARVSAVWDGLGSLPAWAIVLLLVWLVMDRLVTRPAARIATAAERFAGGDRGARFAGASRARGEVARAGEAFDRMADRVQDAETALIRARALLDSILTALPVGVIVVDRVTRRPLFVNPRWREFYGIGLDPEGDVVEALSRTRLERLDGTTFPPAELTIARVLDTGRGAQVNDLVYVRPDGERIPMLISALPVGLTPGADFDAVISVVQDRRDLEAAFRTLRESEQRFETVVSATGQVVYDWTVPSNTIAWSGSLESVLGYPLSAFRGGLAQWESLIHPDDHDGAMAELDRCQRGRRPYDVTYRFRHADGRWIVIRDRGFFLFDDSGAAVRMLGSMSDVTERQQLEHQLRHAQRMETVGTLAGGIAHDFNNQLTGVIGHLDLLGHELRADDPLQEHVRLAYRAAQRCAELTRGLLAFSRQLPAHPRVAVLNDIVNETVTLLRRTLPASVRLTLDLERDPWPIMGDPGQIQQVLLNLCVNARDAMPEGGDLRIRTRNLRAAPRSGGAGEPERVELTVADTGGGIPAAALPRIFEPFFTTKPVGQGTGLGLAMVYGIVAGHGGDVSVDSREGEGAAFHVRFPRASGASTGPAAAAAAPVAGGRETVLVVDDEVVVRELAQRALEGAGYRVVTARDGEEAVRLYRERRAEIDLVLLDLTMPNKSGRVAMQEIAAFDPAARIVLSSGFAPDPGVVGDGLARAFLPKPYPSKALLEIVRRVLDAPAR